MTRILYEKNGFEFQVFEGDLYINDRLVRTRYAYHFSDIENTSQLLATIRAGSTVFPGGYTIVFLMSDCQSICFNCARENLREILSNIKDNDVNGTWRTIHTFINWEDTTLYCAHCNKRIESEYCEN